MTLHDPDDAHIRAVAQDLVARAGTDAAAAELSKRYGRDRAIEALCRAATTGSVMGLADDVEIILDLTDQSEPVVDLTAARRPRPFEASQGHHPALLARRQPNTARRPYWV